MAIQGPGEVVTDEGRLRIVMRSGAGWFYWIAALSLVNTVLVHSGSDVNFLMGLAATLVVDGVARSFVQGGAPEVAVRSLAIGLDLIIAGAFALFGILGQRGRGWAFVAGIALYAADALLFVSFEAWANVAFHAFAGFYLVRGLRAQRALARSVRPAAGATIEVPSASSGAEAPRRPLVR
jgi:hypothetical protein